MLYACAYYISVFQTAAYRNFMHGNDIPTRCNAATNHAQETSLTIEKNNTMLVCFDVDYSILEGHMHNALTVIGRCKPYASDNGLWVIEKGQIQLQDDGAQTNPKYNPDHVKNMAELLFLFNKIPIRDQEGLKSLIAKLLDEGHQFVITTFSSYPDSIKVLLQQLGLEQEQINRIPIIGDLPKMDFKDPNRKMEHIEKAKASTGISCNSNVILVDDSKDNINATVKKGVTGIDVGDNFSWIQVENEANNLVASLDAQCHDQMPTTSRNEDDQKTPGTQSGDKLSNLWQALEFTTCLL